MNFFEELKRRNVFRVGIAYILMGWVLLQGADFVLDLIGAPDWVIRALAVAVVIGLPIALFFAWAFEVTPDGIKRDSEVDRDASIAPKTGRKLDRAIIVFLVLVIAVMGLERFWPSAEQPASSTTAMVETGEANPVSGDIAEAIPAKSIAVLPFADMSQGQDQGWFADGLAEEILNSLARTPDLQVSARTASFLYRGSELELAEIAERLGVAHILEGSVRSSGSRVRVTAQLIRAEDGFHIWSENYDREEADMIEIQEDLAQRIATALETTMDPAELERMSDAGTRSVEAYQAYLRSRALWNQYNASGDRTLVPDQLEQLELARTLDPEFARAHFGVASWWSDQASSWTGSGATELSMEQMLARFDAAIALAIKTASSPADRSLYRAEQARMNLRWSQALPLYQEYRAQRPNERVTSSLWRMVDIMRQLGAEDSLRAELVDVGQSGQRDVTSAIMYISVMRDVDADLAADYVVEAVDLWPDQEALLYQAHRVLLMAGRTEAAASVRQQYLRQFEPNSLLELRHACVSNNYDEALAIVETAENNPTSRFRQSRWLTLKTLGHDSEADALVRSLDNNIGLHDLAQLLTYQWFDPRPLPNMMAWIQREGIELRPVKQMPYACTPPAPPSIAVLPFRDMSAAQDQAYFGEGIAEELLNGLVRLDGLKVASRTSTFALADDGLDIPTLAQRLDVGHILEGSVRTSGKQVRVTAQLIDVSDDKHLWSETFDGTLDDIFQIQDEITGQILAQLQIRLAGKSPTSAAEALTDNPEAYRLYLQGRALWRQRTIEGLQQSVSLLEQSVALDPEFHAAWANLAVVYLNIANYDPEYGVERGEQQAADAADRALSINDQATEALSVKAELAGTRCDQVEAARLFQAAIDSNPREPTPRHWWALRLASYGQIRAAQAEIDEALTLDPMITAVQAVYGMFSALNGDYTTANQAVDAAIALGGPQGMASMKTVFLLLDGSITEVPENETPSVFYPPLIPKFNAALRDPSSLPALEQQALALNDLTKGDIYTVMETLVLAGSEALPAFAERESCPQISFYIWSDRYREQRGTPEFFRYMERAGIVDYWREFGWPDDCASLDQELAQCPR